MTGGIESDRSVLSKNSCSVGKNIQFSAKKIVGNILASNLSLRGFEPEPVASYDVPRRQCQAKLKPQPRGES